LFRRPSVLVEVRDLAAETPDSAWLAGCFGLTPAEARVASLLLSGLDRAAIARELGIAGNTVRVHLARLMNKTETHRQTELVQLLGRVAALRRNS
jgi:DNA-binding CsgD family transcriptional regulator